MTIAHQLILHPAVTNTLKVWSTTVGRDKTYRAIQYFSRFLAWYLYRKGYTKETVARYANLKSTLGQSRKLMRMGKFLEHFQAAIKAVELRDPILKLTAVGRQLSYGAFLIHDSLAWAHIAKVKNFTAPTIARINKRAAQFWLTGIAFSIISGAYKMRDLHLKELQAHKPRSSPEKEAERKDELRIIVAQRGAVRFQLVQDGLDILLPATTLGYFNLDDGMLGIVGFMTSIMGLQTQTTKVLGSK